MKSVGEAMSIGRNFKESLQKALISLETGFSGLDQIFNLSTKQIEKKLKENIPNKLLLVGEAFRKKINTSKVKKYFSKEFMPYEIGYVSKRGKRKINFFNSISW